MYEHDLIKNRCWPNQLNSTDPYLKEQCSYDISSVWQHFSPAADPYAAPDFGNCFAKQLTKQGTQRKKKKGKDEQDKEKS